MASVALVYIRMLQPTVTAHLIIPCTAIDTEKHKERNFDFTNLGVVVSMAGKVLHSF